MRPMRKVAVVIVVAILVVTSLGAGYLVGNSTLRTVTSTSTSISVTTLPSGCSPSQSSGYSSGTLVAGTSSPAIICLQVYWFDANTTITLGATSLLLPTESSARDVSPLANFTVAASQDQILLGGPTNANEGTVVAYSITAKPGASGTYALTVQDSVESVQGPAFLIGVDYIGAHGLETQPELHQTCGGPHVDLVAGNGRPNYVPTPGLSECPVSVGGASFSIPGVSYQVPPNVLCYRIISLTNSTQ
jgi:hypothetical protein